MKLPNSRHLLSLFVHPAVGCLFSIFYIGLLLDSQFRAAPWYYRIFFFIYSIFMGAAIFYGIIYLARARLGTLTSRGSVFGLSVCFLTGIILTLVIPIQSPTFSQKHVVHIVATGKKSPQSQGSEVWLYSITTKKQVYNTNLQEICKGDWELKGNALVSYQNQPSILVCELIATDYVKMQFGLHQWSGIVRLTLDQQATKEKDLFSIDENEENVAFPIGPLTNKRQIAVNVLFTLASGFWIGLLTYTVSIILFTNQKINRYLESNRYLIRINKAFNEWFLETTSMFNKVITLAVVMSFIATSCLFVLPSIMKDSTALKLKTESMSEKPNIIFIISDSVSAEDMSLYGYSLPTTPNLDRITRTWTVYSNAISPITCTPDFFPSIITGRYPYHNRYPNYRIGEMVSKSPNWVDILLLLKKDGYDTWRNGYLTEGFMHLGYHLNHSGTINENGIMHKYWLQPKKLVIKSPYFPYMPLYLTKFFPVRMTDFDVDLMELQAVLESNRYQEPWFLYYHYDGAHGASYYSPDTEGTFLPVEEGMDTLSEKAKYFGKYDIKYQDMVDKLRLRYDEAILQQDRYLANVIQILKEKGLYDSSMIIITADHGQNFSNGYSAHCTPLLSYPETHVPLLIKYPYQTLGKRVDTVVSTIDLTPTFLDVAGIAYDPGWFDGKTLLDASNNPQDRIVFSKQISSFTIAAMNNKWKLTSRRGKLFLFDYHNDPQEKFNLIEQYRNDAEIVALKNSLEQYIAKILLVSEGGVP